LREFLRRCPACGRRFFVRLQSKKLADVEQGTERIAHDVVVVARGPMDSRVIPAGVTYEDVPIEREEFDVTFECHHCRHRWTETVTKSERNK
jgi:predicted  nucleic acid-binding Zn-ribbon protein